MNIPDKFYQNCSSCSWDHGNNICPDNGQTKERMNAAERQPENIMPLLTMSGGESKKTRFLMQSNVWESSTITRYQIIVCYCVQIMACRPITCSVRHQSTASQCQHSQGQLRPNETHIQSRSTPNHYGWCKVIGRSLYWELVSYNVVQNL